MAAREAVVSRMAESEAPRQLGPEAGKGRGAPVRGPPAGGGDGHGGAVCAGRRV